jgi:phage terminase large subunit
MPLWGYLEHGGKRAVEIAHRRWGKDEVALHRACCAAHERIGGLWHMLPEFSQARKAIWTAVNPLTGRRRIDEAFPHELRENTNDQEMFIRFKIGSTWQVIGSDNYDRLVGASVAGVVFSEWARAKPAAWAYIAPIVAENNGWAVFITTPIGRNHAHKLLEMARSDPEWFAEVSTIADTKAVSIEVMEKQRIEYHKLYGVDAGDSLIEQEWYCSFEAAILGAYWGKEIAQAEREGRITNVDVDPNYPVHTAWDLGIDDAMAIWFFQCIAGQIRLVDYHEGHGYGIAHYAALIIQKSKDRGYERGTDYVPHDARQREMTSSGHDGKAKQRIEVMIECGLKPKVIASHHVIDGISAVRQVLPKCWWDKERCEQGLEAERQYQTEWDDDTKTFKKTPLHNWASHGADAKRTLAIAYREIAPLPLPERGRMLTIGDPSTLPEGVQGVRFDDLWRKKGRNRRI